MPRLITKKTRVLMNAAAISWEKRKSGATRLPSLMRRYSAWRHYYDEDNIKVEKIPANTGSSVSGLSASTVLTEEDKEKAREAALRRLEEEQYALLKKKPTRAKKEIIEVQQMSLF